MNKPTAFSDPALLITRKTEVPAWNDGTGMDLSGACSCGIGINIDGGTISGQAQQFTLLDQDGEARTPQNGQFIGGSGSGNGSAGKGTKPIVTGALKADGSGGFDGVPSSASLTTLAEGWKGAVV